MPLRKPPTRPLELTCNIPAYGGARRRNATIEGASANLSHASNDNQLLSYVGAVSPSYLGGATSLTFTYNNAGRLVLVQSGGTTIASCAVNALGQRVSKAASGVKLGWALELALRDLLSGAHSDRPVGR